MAEEEVQPAPPPEEFMMSPVERRLLDDLFYGRPDPFLFLDISYVNRPADRIAFRIEPAQQMTLLPNGDFA